MIHQASDYELLCKLTHIMCDNSNAICLSKNLVHYSRAKHIDRKYHFIGDNILKGNIKVSSVSIEAQLADIFIKSLLEEDFIYFYEIPYVSF